MKKKLNLKFDIDTRIPDIVVSDELRIRQIISNLLTNAIKFTSKGSVTFVVYQKKSSEGDQALVFRVLDTGIGISKENQEKLFDSFTQADNSISRRYGGSGLGLSICKKLISMLGGSISMSSTLGKGTQIHLEIPCKFVDNSKAHKVCNDNLPEIPNFSDLNVLIVEDNIVNQKVMNSFLKKNGSVYCKCK